jgi:ribosome-binding factor A
MPKDFPRHRRIADQIMRELADLFLRDMNDPRIKMVSIFGVEVSRDLAHAKVYVSSMNENDDMAEIITVLNHAAGHLRHELGSRLRLRTTPDLKFYHDDSLEKGMRVSRLLRDAAADKGQ